MLCQYFFCSIVAGLAGPPICLHQEYAEAAAIILKRCDQSYNSIRRSHENSAINAVVGIQYL
jgi:hypothetical protein